MVISASFGMSNLSNCSHIAVDVANVYSAVKLPCIFADDGRSAGTDQSSGEEIDVAQQQFRKLIDFASNVANKVVWVDLRKPRLWNCPETEETTSAAVVHDDVYVYVLYKLPTSCSKTAEDSMKIGGLQDPMVDFSWAGEGGMPEECKSVVHDDRCEVFLWPTKGSSREANFLQNSHYYAIEANREGNALLSETRFFRDFDFFWKRRLDKMEDEAGGYIGKFVNFGDLGNSSADQTEANSYFVSRIRKDAVELDNSSREIAISEYKMGLYKGVVVPDLQTFAWSSWIDPGDDKVDFHRPETFGVLRLLQ